MVNGDGPNAVGDSGHAETHGEGYGAGGGGHVCCVDESWLIGSPGVIVLDFKLEE